VKKPLLLISFCCFLFSGLQAQTQTIIKIGYVNSDSLIPLIPGRDSVLGVIKTLVKSYEEQLIELGLKYQTSYNAFKKDSSSLIKDSIKARIVKLLKLKKEIKDFKADTKEKLKNQQDELLLPLISKAENAIAAVARENGYIFIIDTSETNGMTLLYADKRGDITDLVKKKLGILK